MSKDNKKNQGIFETVRQVDEKERQQREKAKEAALKREEKQREEYAKNLAEEKVELLRLKQGVITKSEKLDFENETVKKYTVWQKIGNFLYHNKWWLGITTFIVIIAAFLVYDKLTAKEEDINIMLLCNDSELYMRFDKIGEYIDGLIDDYNEDGEIYSNILYIPISENEEENLSALNPYGSNLTKLSTEFQMGETMLVIADSKSDELVQPEDTLVDLEEIYPDNPYIKGYGFYINSTDFAKIIGYEDNLPDDIYIGVRKVTKTLSPDEKTQENYEYAMKTLDKIIENLSKLDS